MVVVHPRALLEAELGTVPVVGVVLDQHDPGQSCRRTASAIVVFPDPEPPAMPIDQRLQSGGTGRRVIHHDHVRWIGDTWSQP